MRTLIVGAGEIGKSLFNVLDKYYECCIIDKNEEVELDYDIMHICFPYSELFISQVNAYSIKYNPKYIVVHSTVPVGTCEKIGAMHSPCIGIHPHLEESMLTFTKFIGGQYAHEIAQYFRRAGMRVYITDKASTTELMKIMSTTFYGMCIEYTKEVKRQCDKEHIPFEMWTLWTENYNKGYEKLGYPEYSRPNLIPMMCRQKGHCVLPNLDFLDSKFSKLIKELNKDE